MPASLAAEIACGRCMIGVCGVHFEHSAKVAGTAALLWRLQRCGGPPAWSVTPGMLWCTAGSAWRPFPHIVVQLLHCFPCRVQPAVKSHVVASRQLQSCQQLGGTFLEAHCLLQVASAPSRTCMAVVHPAWLLRSQVEACGCRNTEP